MVAPVDELGFEFLHQCDRHDHVDVEHRAQDVEVDRAQRGERAGAEGARVVDEQLHRAELRRRPCERGAVGRIGDVAGDADDAGAGRERGHRCVEPLGPPGVDHEGVPRLRERRGEREAESLRSAGDDGDGWSARAALFHGGLLGRS